MLEVNKFKFYTLFFVLLISACATPVAPTGGEPDRSGPALVSTQPENNTVNYRERVIRFTFADYVDRNSFRQALSIEPNISVPFEVSWRRKTATISLLEPLPNNTTVIFNLGTDLRDTRGNRLRSPISLGLSTGPEIDMGEASIRLKPLRPGISIDNVRILLYREPFDFTKPALYVAEPDTAGIANFSYLANGSYAAIAVHDVNRNRTWDPPREYGQPASQRSFELESERLDMGTIYYARMDTVSTVLEGIGLLSTNRLRLRFSRPITYHSETEISIINIDDADTLRAGLLFVDPSDENVALFHSTTQLDELSLYTVNLHGFRDRNGRRKINSLEPFFGSSEPDTTFIRFKKHLTQEGVRGTEPIKIMYTGVLTGTDILDSLQVFRNRTRDDGSVRVETSYNLIKIFPENRWLDADSYDIRTWDPAQQRHVEVTARIIRDTELGEIQINVTDSLFTGIPLFLEVYNSSGESVLKKDFEDNYLIENLAPGNYHLVVFQNKTNSAQWNPGSISPFEPASPVFVNSRVPVRSRMTSEVDIDFRPLTSD